MLSKTRRLFTIFIVLQRYQLLEFLPAYSWLSFPGSRNNHLSRAQRVHLALESLGPIFIKLGQMLSTRPDLIPADIAEELAKLQDAVPPFPAAQARASIEAALEGPLDQFFDHFEEKPLGSASIAQVHGAVLKNGDRVVIKVLRPDIHALIARDLSLIQLFSRLIKRHLKKAGHLHLNKVADEFEQTLTDELDLVREAANCSVMKRLFAAHRDVTIPKVYWEFTRHNIATFERIHGTPINDLEALKAQGIDLKMLARMGVELFFTQVFRDSYFHADMHPGNIFITPPDASGKPRWVLVDFGIMGTLSAVDQRYLAQNLLAFIQRDYRRVAELHIESGWVPKDTRVDLFEGAIRAVCEPMLEQPIKDISFGKLLLRLFQTAQRFHMQLQPQLVLLQKTILNVEGVGRMLDPELNVWETATPIIKTWLKETVGFRATLRELKAALSRHCEGEARGNPLLRWIASALRASQ
jgi:ubiquinone biosynthesis protein